MASSIIKNGLAKALNDKNQVVEVNVELGGKSYTSADAQGIVTITASDFSIDHLNKMTFTNLPAADIKQVVVGLVQYPQVDWEKVESYHTILVVKTAEQNYYLLNDSVELALELVNMKLGFTVIDEINFKKFFELPIEDADFRTALKHYGFGKLTNASLILQSVEKALG
jgi:hypothetical protein